MPNRLSSDQTATDHLGQQGRLTNPLGADQTWSGCTPARFPFCARSGGSLSLLQGSMSSRCLHRPVRLVLPSLTAEDAGPQRFVHSLNGESVIDPSAILGSGMDATFKEEGRIVR